MASNSDKYAKLAFVLMASDSMSDVLKAAAENANKSFSKIEVAAGKVGQVAMKQGMHMKILGEQIGGAMLNIVKETAKYGDESAKTARSVGMQTEEWQKLAHAADYSGVSADELAGSFNKLNKFIADAGKGSKENVKLFKDLGISFKDASGNLRNSKDVFKDIVGVLSNVEDGAAKSAVEMQFFGKTGTKLASLINSGTASIEELEAEAERMGLVFDGTKFENFNDSMTRVGKSILGAKMQIGNALLPAVEKVTEVINKTIQSVTSWTKEHEGLTKIIAIGVAGLGGLLFVAGLVSVGIGGLAYIVLQCGRALRVMSGICSTVKTAFFAAKNSMVLFKIQYYALAAAQKIAAAGQWLFNTSLFGCPVVWIVLGIAAVIAAAVLLVKNWDKVSAFFSELWDGIKSVFSSVWEWIKNIFLKYTPHGLIITHWDKITAFFSELWRKVGAVFSSIPAKFREWGKNIMQGLIDGIKVMINKPIEMVENIGKSIKDKFTSLLGIHSPSRLFMEYGVNITQGLTGGIDSGTSKVSGATGRLAESTVGGFESNIIPASEIFNTNNSSSFGGSPVTYTQNINFSGSMGSEQDRQDFAQLLRQHASEVVNIINRDASNRKRLSFS